MGYDVTMIGPYARQRVMVRRFTMDEDGRPDMDAMRPAHFILTFNHAEQFCEGLQDADGIKVLHGRTGRECDEMLLLAIKRLGLEYSGRYYDEAPGNAGLSLRLLLDWCLQHPDGVFQVE